MAFPMIVILTIRVPFFATPSRQPRNAKRGRKNFSLRWRRKKKKKSIKNRASPRPSLKHFSLGKFVGLFCVFDKRRAPTQPRHRWCAEYFALASRWREWDGSVVKRRVRWSEKDEKRNIASLSRQRSVERADVDACCWAPTYPRSLTSPASAFLASFLLLASRVTRRKSYEEEKKREIEVRVC